MSIVSVGNESYLEEQLDKEIEKNEELLHMLTGVLDSTVSKCTAKTWLKLNYPEYMAEEAGYPKRV